MFPQTELSVRKWLVQALLDRGLEWVLKDSRGFRAAVSALFLIFLDNGWEGKPVVAGRRNTLLADELCRGLCRGRTPLILETARLNPETDFLVLAGDLRSEVIPIMNRVQRGILPPPLAIVGVVDGPGDHRFLARESGTLAVGAVYLADTTPNPEVA